MITKKWQLSAHLRLDLVPTCLTAIHPALAQLGQALTGVNTLRLEMKLAWAHAYVDGGSLARDGAVGMVVGAKQCCAVCARMRARTEHQHMAMLGLMIG